MPGEAATIAVEIDNTACSLNVKNVSVTLLRNLTLSSNNAVLGFYQGGRASRNF